MAKAERVRPFEGLREPLKARNELRHMFERWLPYSRYVSPVFSADDLLHEISILTLCEDYRLEYPGGANVVASLWDESVGRLEDGGPTFADLTRLGWLQFDGGRWILERAPIGTFSYINYPSPSTKKFLTTLGSLRLVAKSVTPHPKAQALSSLIAEKWIDRRIPMKDPYWLAARLWERLCPKPQPFRSDSIDGVVHEPALAVHEPEGPYTMLDPDPDAVDAAFLEWSAWCRLLGIGGRWSANWGAAEMCYCREAANRVLERQRIWGNWDNDAARYREVLETTFAIPLEQLRYGRSPRLKPPPTLVARADWLGWPEVEHVMMERLGAGTISFAFELLCSELEQTDIGPNITTSAESILSFAAEHPMALQHLLLRVNSVPALLVDMLMYPRTACLATKLAIEWRSGSGWSTDCNASRDAQTKVFAVQDCLSLLAYFLGKGSIYLDEYASLINWCYAGSSDTRKAVADSRRPVGRQLLEIVATAKEELQYALLQHLADQANYENNVPRARFAAILSALCCFSNVHIDVAFPIVAVYVKFARDLHLEWTDAPDLPADLAAQLIMVGFAHGKAERDTLLIPFDSVKRLREMAEEDGPSLRSSMARTLRQHVRLLSRAVAGWARGDVPTELCNALRVLISRSVVEHTEKGRMGALTDRYSLRSIFAREDGSPAMDLSAAWRRMDDTHQAAMLQALCLSDDPVLLAQLCQHMPAAPRLVIQARLRQLRPGEASEFWTWPELEQRIAALLAAGEFGLAREHLEEVRDDLERAPPQYRINLFGLELQLLLKEENWTALDNAIIPAALVEAMKRNAQDQLQFYIATSQLLRPDGNLSKAQAILQRLASRVDASSSYRENMFAVAIQQLLGSTIRPLTGARHATGASLLVEINEALAQDKSLARSHLIINRALLLLALQRPEDALKSVADRRNELRNTELEIIAVLANAELGRRTEAMAILDTAISEFGQDDRLTVLKGDLEAGNPTPTVALASFVVDPLISIRAALQQLTELRPSQIGEILGPSGEGVRGYLVRQVSRAVAALQHMSAILRDRKKRQDDHKFEDDLNTAVREVLGALLSVVKWDVADQSLGGTTVNGNPGKRDAVIRVSGQELAIYEALVCFSVNKKYSKEHFDKLVSYGVCDLYFHVTYSYAKEVQPLLDYMEYMLKHEVPPGLTYLDHKIITTPDYETSGYMATYQADHREIAVAFMIADLKVR